MTTDHGSHVIEHLSGFIDGDLTDEDFRRVEAHLGTCGRCREVLADLRDVISGAGELGGVQPPRDLWGGIAATIQAPVPEAGAKVIALPLADRRIAGDVGSEGPRWLHGWPRLAAAAVVLAFASSALTWAVAYGPDSDVGPDAAAAPATGDPFAFVSIADEAPEGMAEELRRLEEVLRSSGGALDANTLRILERNLAVIERAIEDSRRALEQDPGNAFLSEHLGRSYDRKLEYLRDAARLAEWAG